MCIRDSLQSLSFQPVVQSHLYDPRLLIQVPLCWQGEFSHSFVSENWRSVTWHKVIFCYSFDRFLGMTSTQYIPTSQLCPSHPTAQLHVNDPALFIQVPLLWQGELSHSLTSTTHDIWIHHLLKKLLKIMINLNYLIYFSTPISSLTESDNVSKD